MKKMKLSKKGKIIIGSGILIILFIVVSICLVSGNVVFKINGDTNITILLPNSYEELGVTAQKCRLFGCED